MDADGASSSPSALELALHRRWFHGLLLRPLSKQLQASLHPQRLLLTYFGVVGSHVTHSSMWEEDPNRVDAVVEDLRRCYDPSSGGFYPEPPTRFVTTPTLTMTQCAVYCLWRLGRLHTAALEWLNIERLVSYVWSCMQPSTSGVLHGAFAAVSPIHLPTSEVDVRFSYSAMVTLFLAHNTSLAPCVTDPKVLRPRLTCPAAAKELHAARDYIVRCWSQHEGGFGGTPESESHGGMTFCAVASLSFLGFWDDVDDLTGDVVNNRNHPSLMKSMRRKALRWCVARLGCGPASTEYQEEGELAAWERVGSGIGFQGRPNKPHDTCYTFWIGGALSILERCEGMPGGAVEDDRLVTFVQSCSGAYGGVGKDDGSDVDPLHTTLALAGLRLRVPTLFGGSSHSSPALSL